MYNLREKYGAWALITGASSGIGAEFAKVLARERVNLVIIARRIERLNSLAGELSRDYNIKVISIQADLSREQDIDKIKTGCSGLGIGMLINNAGAGNNVPFESSAIEEELQLLQLNCLTPVILTKFFLSQMVSRKKGAVIFVGSVVGAMPNPGMALYSASKAFDNILGSALWYSQKKNNVDILSVAPGGTRTEFHDKANIKRGPVNASPEDVVHTALKALGSKPFVVNGFINKLVYIFSRLIPFKWFLIMSGIISEKRKRPA